MTLVLHEPAKIATTAIASNQQRCNLLNEGSEWPRMILSDSNRQRHVVYSKAECETYLYGSCSFRELDWDLKFTTMPQSLYLKMYK